MPDSDDRFKYSHPQNIPGGINRGPMSLVEPAHLSPRQLPGHTVYEQPVVEIDDGEGDVVETPPPASVSGPPRPVPVVRQRPASTQAAPEQLPAAQVIGGPSVQGRNWTMDDAQPAPAAPPRKAITVENPEVPKAGRKVRVTIGHFGPANEEERKWVVRGDPGYVLDIPGGSGTRPRRVTLYIAFLVTDVTEDDNGDREVKGIVRFHGVPLEREGTFGTKLMQDGGERHNQLVKTLEYFLAFPAVRPGMAVQILVSPMTDPKKIRRYRYMYSSGKPGHPAITIKVNTVVADAADKAALDHYRAVSFPWFHCFVQWTWPFIDMASWRLYQHGRQVALGYMGDVGNDGLDPKQRLGLLSGTAEMAAEPAGSLFRAIFRDDPEVSAAMSREGLPRLAATRIGTMYEEGDE